MPAYNLNLFTALYLSGNAVHMDYRLGTKFILETFRHLGLAPF